MQWASWLCLRRRQVCPGCKKICIAASSTTAMAAGGATTMAAGLAATACALHLLLQALQQIDEILRRLRATRAAAARQRVKTHLQAHLRLSGA